jgi:hypothetical protein
MTTRRFSASNLLSAASLLLLVGLALGWLSGESLGQQRQATPARVGNSDLQMSGHFHVRLNVPVPGETAAEKSFQKVHRVVLQDEWAILNLIEEDEETTLVYPRDKLYYIKVWEVKEDEERR